MTPPSVKDCTLRIAVWCLSAALSSCSHPSLQPDARNANAGAVSPPTATEVFNLRSKCAELGQKIMENNFIGSALTQDVVTHYDSQTNRCYADLHVNKADLSKFNEYYSRSVYDGQTGEMLASVTNKDGQKSAYLKDGGVKLTDWDAAVTRMEALMTDDHKQ